MKKLSALLIAAGMVAASAAPASAVDVKVDGIFQYTFGTKSMGFNGDNYELAAQRLRLGLTFAASENLSAYTQFQILGGQMGTAGTNAGDVTDTKVRQMYMDWTVPGTAIKVRMGRQCLGLPADAFGGNAVIDAGWGCHDGIVVAAPVTDWLGLTALWTRTGYADHATDKADLDTNYSNDVYAAAANLKFDGVSASVYAAFATFDDFATQTVGTGAGIPAYAGQAYWIGATSTWTFFDPFTVKLSAAFGEYNADDSTKDERKGWNVQAKASYAMGWGTPVLGAWYFSGDDKDDAKLGGTMPSVQGYFTPTRTYHDAAWGIGGGQCYSLPSGNWGVQVGIEGMSFVNGLAHDFLVTYMEGTNDKSKAGIADEDYLTEEDSLVSFDFVTSYEIYKNLSAALELSYIISDFEDTTARRTAGVLDEDDWRAELNFTYKF